MTAARGGSAGSSQLPPRPRRGLLPMQRSASMYSLRMQGLRHTTAECSRRLAVEAMPGVSSSWNARVSLSQRMGVVGLLSSRVAL